MYELVLTAHSWLRWVALIAGLMAVVMASTASPRADRWGLILVIALDIQLLLGFALYLVLSPNTKAILGNFGAAMRDPVARFWAVEHVSLMLFAVVMAHVGRVLARKAASPAAKRKRLLVCFALSTMAMIAATPWPGMASGRPLFRV
jgi:hypothetical protein